MPVALGLVRDLSGQGSMQIPDFSRLQSVVRDQVVEAGLAPDALRDGQDLHTATGKVIHVSGTGADVAFTVTTSHFGGMGLGGTSVAHLVGAPIVCEDGIIYPVDVLFTR